MKLTQQQLLAVKLIEMPLEEFEQNIIDEMNVNPALEERHDDDIKDFDSIDAESDNGGYEGDEATDEQLDASNRKEQDEEREKALERMDNEDELPENDNEGYFDAEYKDVVNSNQESFLDNLREQMGELELTPDETIIMEYLIGSLDSDGLLHTDLDSITEYLYCYYNMNAVEKDVEAVLTKLQTFDPAGIGARNLQECLLLQVDRMEEGMMKNYIRTIITECYEDFSKNHWYKIQKELNLGDEQMETIRKTVKRRLNPRPGYALGEAV
ncbi:MAG: RNA polymerase sigma-54 factor, partial [Prevotellaceae bacterium]|nr:RNA polymerase sigma-54 factor [Prevotellaceae bacterium]